MTIDCTLSKLVIPGFPEMNPGFGTKKVDGNSSSAREATQNAMLPFERQRPITVTENSNTSEIQAHTSFVIQNGGVTLTLGNGAFVGCNIQVFNLSDGNVNIAFGAEVVTLANGEDIKLEWNGKWKTFKGDEPVGYAPLNSPSFTGTPKVPAKSSAVGSDGTLIATEAQVKAVKDSIPNPASFVQTSGAQTIAGQKTFSTMPKGPSSRSMVSAERSGTTLNLYTS